MAKYVRVTKVPTELTKGEYVVEAPNFFDEIKDSRGKVPKSGHFTANYLREVIAVAGIKYAPDTFMAATDVNLAAWRNRAFTSEESINKTLVAMFRKECPNMLDWYVDYHIKQRPFGTKLIYFTGDHLDTNAFTSNGVDEIKEKEIASYLGTKKRVTKNTDQ